MTYASLEHFRDVTSRNVLALQEAKEKGRKVVGQFCIYSPLEIALAAGAVPVSLCGTKQDSIPVAEEVLPRCLCPLIKSSFGFALQDSCPYLAASDIVVADATCDGKKKMYELLAAYKPVMLLQLPQIQDERAHAYWREQYAMLVARLEQDFGCHGFDFPSAAGSEKGIGSGPSPSVAFAGARSAGHLLPGLVHAGL